MTNCNTTKLLTLFLLVIHAEYLFAQPDPRINPRLLDTHWQAQWIMPPEASSYDYGVYHFRKEINLQEVPASFIVHVSADNRYKLFINGEYIGNGPARGDNMNWRFETYDLTPVLKPGKNVIAATVWNFGDYMPWAQMSTRTGFIMQGNEEAEHIVNTDQSWLTMINPAYQPFRVKTNSFRVVGPGDLVDGNQYPWGWEKTDYNDQSWSAALEVEEGTPKEIGTGAFWMLVPRTIPTMEENLLRIGKIRRSNGIDIEEAFLEGNQTVQIPPNSSASILFDQTHLTMAYPELIISGGENANIRLTYSEAMFDDQGQKGNRNVIEGKEVIGYADVFIPDGGEDRLYRPLWFRTYRYIRMDIETKADPLTLKDFYGMFTAYPFLENATFASDDPSHRDIWQVGWRTARLCAGETYFDCPYYEQLQYVGDTRIQALISLYVDGDARLMKKAISIFDESRLPSGLTQSRYPSHVTQVIPPYSLFWVSMIYDYWMHREDDEFIKPLLTGVQGVLQWYENHIGEDGILGPMPWWNFVDWAKEWPWVTEKRIGGVPPGGSIDDGGSSIITLQYIYNLQYAASLMEAYGQDYFADHYLTLAEKLKSSVHETCWDESRGLYADTPAKTTFSEHANIMAVLVDLVPETEQKTFMEKVLAEEQLIETTFYYMFYLVRAAKKAGLADRYNELLDPWRKMLDLGLTTFAEKPEPTRSDCHAWSASPNYDFLATVCGIEPAAPGFKEVRIAPKMGELNQIEASMPHPSGTIRVKLTRSDKKIKGTVELPSELSGVFEWEGKEIQLRGGVKEISL